MNNYNVLVVRSYRRIGHDKWIEKKNTNKNSADDDDDSDDNFSITFLKHFSDVSFTHTVMLTTTVRIYVAQNTFFLYVLKKMLSNREISCIKK